MNKGVDNVPFVFQTAFVSGFLGGLSNIVDRSGILGASGVLGGLSSIVDRSGVLGASGISFNGSRLVFITFVGFSI